MNPCKISGSAADLKSCLSFRTLELITWNNDGGGRVFTYTSTQGGEPGDGYEDKITEWSLGTCYLCCYVGISVSKVEETYSGL